MIADPASFFVVSPLQDTAPPHFIGQTIAVKKMTARVFGPQTKCPPCVSHRFRAKRRRALGLKETVPEKASAGATIDSSPEGGGAESKEESKGQEEDQERKEETKTEDGEGKEQEGESKDRGDEESDDPSKKASKVPSETEAQDQQETTSFGLGK